MKSLLNLKKNALEWTVFGFGGLTVLFVVGVLARESVRTPSPARIVLTTGPPERRGDLWYVPVRVENGGGAALGAVAVRAESEKESAGFDLDYVPGESSREGVLVFQRKPERLEAKVAGAEKP